MPFRERAKALFRHHKSRSGSNSLSNASSNNSSRDQWPANVYKPGEPMPRPKYRRPPTKEHKEKLESFSFADAWRRKSFQSQHSPMGTRMPSRRNSLFSIGSRKKSYAASSRAPSRGPSSRGPSRGVSRTNSVTSVGAEGGGAERSAVAARQRDRFGGGTRLPTEVEAEGDDDVGNVGLSRVQSHEHHRPRPLTAEDRRAAPLSTAHDHEPFSEQDLALALQRSHLAVPTS